MENKHTYISQGNRPFWHRIIASLCFTLCIFCLYKISTQADIRWFYLVPLSFSTGLSFSIVHDYHFDFENKKYKIEKHVGPIKFGRWKPFKKIEYLSVFKNGKGFYEVNLWYNKNKRFNIINFEELDITLETGKTIAKKLNIDLLDAATDPRDSKWVTL